MKLADSFGEMTNLSMALREKLGRDYEIARVDLVERQISKADPTEKFLFELADGNMVESVLMKYDYGNSVCISSQAGCRMGCPVLRLHHRRPEAEPEDVRDAPAGVPDPEDHRGAGVQHRGHGNRGAA